MAPSWPEGFRLYSQNTKYHFIFLSFVLFAIQWKRICDRCEHVERCFELIICARWKLLSLEILSMGTSNDRSILHFLHSLFFCVGTMVLIETSYRNNSIVVPRPFVYYGITKRFIYQGLCNNSFYFSHTHTQINIFSNTDYFVGCKPRPVSFHYYTMHDCNQNLNAHINRMNNANFERIKRTIFPFPIENPIIFELFIFHVFNFWLFFCFWNTDANLSCN